LGQLRAQQSTRTPSDASRGDRGDDPTRAGLIRATRHGRYVRYAVRFEGMRQLLTYLTQDCCQGNPQLCGTTIKKAKSVCK
jgi:hypothetical protein